MMRVAGVMLLFWALPYLVLGALGVVIKWPGETFTIIALVVLSPIIGGVAYGLWLGGQQAKEAAEKERQRQARAALAALNPSSPDDVPPLTITPPHRPAALPAPAKRLPGSQKRLPASLEGIGNQWRAGLKLPL